MSSRKTFFNYFTYKTPVVIQQDKTSELDTVGSESISESINRMLARGELDKFLREKELETFRNSISSDITDEEISILNIKHLDKVDVNTAYNKLRARVLSQVNYLKNQNINPPSPTNNVGDNNTSE